MDSTSNPPTDSISANASRTKADLANGARNIKDMAANEFHSLMADVEELLSRVADVKDPDVIRIRNKVRDTVATARETITTGADTIQRQARNMAGAADDYVRDNHWQSIGIAALVGVAFGFLAGRRS